jgi:hypothetical protein
MPSSKTNPKFSVRKCYQYHPQMSRPQMSPHDPNSHELDDESPFQFTV